MKIDYDDILDAINEIDNRIIAKGGPPYSGAGQVNFLYDYYSELPIIEHFFSRRKNFGTKTTHSVIFGYVIAMEIIKKSKGNLL